MRFGRIGYGAWGRHHATAIEKVPGATVAAVACRTEASATEARRDLPRAAVYLDYQQLLDRPDIDAVDVVVPNHLHAEIGTAALERGKDVLLEKPMAPTLAKCDRLMAAARDSRRVLTIGHELRLSRQWGRVKALLDAGDIGEPRYALVSLFRFPYRPGSGRWRYEAERVGSWVLEELVHHFDLLMWYSEGWGTPVSVLSLGNASSGDPRRSDNFSTVLRFREPLYAVVTKTVTGFEYHLAIEIVELKLKRRGQRGPRPWRSNCRANCSSSRRTSARRSRPSPRGVRSSRPRRRGGRCRSVPRPSAPSARDGKSRLRGPGLK